MNHLKKLICDEGSKQLNRILILVISIFCLSHCAFPQQLKPKKNEPISIIFDTDIGPDYDDIGALAMLHAMADSGECTILATIASNKHQYIAAVLDVMNTYFNRPGLPIGVVRGNAVTIDAWQKWDSLLAANYTHDINSNEQAEDALKLYRRLLSTQPDKSVTIVTVGFLTNMANLLQSGPDEYSSLPGKSLVAKKVKQLVCMAGRFDGEMGSFKEFNVAKDSTGSKLTFDSWPTPILFSGFEIGAKIFSGLPIANSALHRSPVKDVFALCIPKDTNDSKGRMSWDETAVLVAVRGYEKYYSIVQGKIICNRDGTNGWDLKGTRDKYIIQKSSIASMEKLINSLMMHQPMKSR
ncbi:MAG: nucleoside hydrolase [Chitinophagaceae bacterium]